MFNLGDIIKNGVHYGSGLPIETYHKINNISNPNLLTNPNFKINTKGLNVYSSNLDRFETVDKWYAQKNISVLLGDEGLTITNTSDTNHDMTGFSQDIDNVSDII